MTQTPTELKVNYELVNQVVDLIPVSTWDVVINAIISSIVDNMPSEIVKGLTGKETDFDGAENFLRKYYAKQKSNKTLIQDAFKILGEEYVLHLLDSFQLDKLDEVNQKNEM
jgi:hypothetical protein